MVGGYFMVDAVGLDIDSPTNTDGLYDKLHTAMSSNKPIVLCNAVYGNRGLISPVPVVCSKLPNNVIAVNSAVGEFSVEPV